MLNRAVTRNAVPAHPCASASLHVIDVRHPTCHPAGDLQLSKSSVHADL